MTFPDSRGLLVFQGDLARTRNGRFFVRVNRSGRFRVNESPPEYVDLVRYHRRFTTARVDVGSE